MTDLLPCVEIEPGQAARATVIWLHGLGADGHDFEPIVPHLGLEALDSALAVRFVFPTAPTIPVTINGGFEMPAWYDIRDGDLAARHDDEGILRSSEQTSALIARENERGIPSERILLAGFSQGGAIATHVALRHPKPLAGLVALSAYLVRGGSLDQERSDANRPLAVFAAHGSLDPVVEPERGEELRLRLVELGHDVSWHTWPMQHEVCLEEMQVLGTWMAEHLADAATG